jgi:hypothetical protein
MAKTIEHRDADGNVTGTSRKVRKPGIFSWLFLICLIIGGIDMLVHALSHI